MWVIIGVIILILIGIIFLGGHSPHKKSSRMEFLAEIAKVLEGRLEPILDKPNSFMIRCRFEGEEFVFEDLEEKSFKGIVNRVFLKSQTASTLTLTFTEKQLKATRGHMVVVSDIPDEPIPETEKIEVPEKLKEFNVFSKTITKANEFFKDTQMAQVLSEFKNRNERGFSSLSLRITNGEVSLEFLTGLSAKPSLEHLYSNTASIENYLEQVLPVVKRLKYLSLS